MAIMVLFECPGMTQAHYDTAAKRLTNGGTLRSLADWQVAAKGCPDRTSATITCSWTSRAIRSLR